MNMGGCSYENVTCFLYIFSTGTLFSVKCIGRTFVMYKEMYVFQFFLIGFIGGIA